MKDINKIIIHCSATREGEQVSALEIDRWHKKRGWKGIGYHYVISLDGSIELGRDIKEMGAHTKGENANSIGICYIGGVEKEKRNGKWIPKDTRTNEQKETLILLLQVLKKMFTNATIHGHNDFANKACPSFNATKEYNNLKSQKNDRLYTSKLDGIINWLYGFIKNHHKPNTN